MDNLQNTRSQRLIAAPWQATKRISNFKLTDLHKLHDVRCSLDIIGHTPESLAMYTYFDWVWFAQNTDQSSGQEKQGLRSDQGEGRTRWRFNVLPAFHQWNIAHCDIWWRSHGSGRRRHCNFISDAWAHGHGDHHELWFHRHLSQGNWNKLNYMYIYIYTCMYIDVFTCVFISSSSSLLSTLKIAIKQEVGGSTVTGHT